jgi:hypothetical protein
MEKSGQKFMAARFSSAKANGRKRKKIFLGHPNDYSSESIERTGNMLVMTQVDGQTRKASGYYFPNE